MEISWFAITLTAIGIFFCAVTSLLGVFFKRKSLIKYIPSILCLTAFGAFIIKARFFSSGFEDIGYIILAMIAAGSFVLSIISALVMEIINRRR